MPTKKFNSPLCLNILQLLIILFILSLLNHLIFGPVNVLVRIADSNKKPKANKDDAKLTSWSEKPFLFIGGNERSGASLMRVILDTHVDLNCGPETRVLPIFLSFIKDFKIVEEGRVSGGKSKEDEEEDWAAVDESAQIFIRSFLEKRSIVGNRVPRILCAKDTSILYSMDYLHGLFPAAKFVYMIRDGRSSSYSSLRVRNQPLTLYHMLAHFNQWNENNRVLSTSCAQLGAGVCRMVKYEDLVVRSEATIRQVACEFLGLNWTSKFLHHENFVVNGQVVVADNEWAAEQVKMAIFNDSLIGWLGNIDFYGDLIKELDKFDMMKKFEYV